MLCRFCEIHLKEEGVVYENDYFFAIFDIFPVTPGHTLIIPVKHIESFFNLSQNEWMYLQRAVSDVVKIIEKTDFEKVYRKILSVSSDEKSTIFCKKALGHIGLNKKPDGYNIGINEGEAAGRTVHHLHIHVIPRFYGDVKDRIGGIRNIIPNMGNYK